MGNLLGFKTIKSQIFSYLLCHNFEQIIPSLSLSLYSRHICLFSMLKCRWVGRGGGTRGGEPARASAPPVKHIIMIQAHRPSPSSLLFCSLSRVRLSRQRCGVRRCYPLCGSLRIAYAKMGGSPDAVTSPPAQAVIGDPESLAKKKAAIRELGPAKLQVRSYFRPSLSSAAFLANVVAQGAGAVLFVVFSRLMQRQRAILGNKQIFR